MAAPSGTRERVLEVARGELGTVESPAGSNKQKYGVFYGMNGVAWCMEFVWYVLVHAGVKLPPPIKTAYTPTSAATFQKAGRWLVNTSKDVQPGDVVHFYWPNMGRIAHVGIVEEVRADGTLVCIEGNTDSAGGRSGGRVMRQIRSRATVHPNGGFGQPIYVTDEEDDMFEESDRTLLKAVVDAVYAGGSSPNATPLDRYMNGKFTALDAKLDALASEDQKRDLRALAILEELRELPPAGVSEVDASAVVDEFFKRLEA